MSSTLFDLDQPCSLAALGLPGQQLLVPRSSLEQLGLACWGEAPARQQPAAGAGMRRSSYGNNLGGAAEGGAADGAAAAGSVAAPLHGTPIALHHAPLCTAATAGAASNRCSATGSAPAAADLNQRVGLQTGFALVPDLEAIQRALDL